MLIEVSYRIESIALNPALTDDQIASQIQQIIQNYSHDEQRRIIQRDFYSGRGDNDSAIMIAIKRSLPRTASVLLYMGGGIAQFKDTFNQSFFDVYNLVSKCPLGAMPLFNAPDFTASNMTWIEAFRNASPEQITEVINANRFPNSYHRLADTLNTLNQINLILTNSDADEVKATKIKDILQHFQSQRRNFRDLYAITQGFGSIDSPFRTAIRLNLPHSLKALSHKSGASFCLYQFSSKIYWPHNNLEDLLALVNEYPAIGNTNYTHIPLGNGVPDYQHTFLQALEFCVREQRSYGFTGVYQPQISYQVRTIAPAPVVPTPVAQPAILNQFPRVTETVVAATTPTLTAAASTSPITRFIDANNLREKIEYKTGIEPEIKLPEECYCPIGQGLMEDPVANQVGQVYEKKQIQQYYQFERSAGRIIRDVVTREPITDLGLFPSLPTRNLILNELKASLEKLNNSPSNKALKLAN